MRPLTVAVAKGGPIQWRSCALSFAVGLWCLTLYVSSETAGNITHNEKVRLFLEYRPDAYVAGNPALVVLHGGYSSMSDLFNPAGRLKELSNQYGLFVLAPNAANLETGDTLGRNQTWNDLRNDGIDSDMDDVGFLAALVDWAVRERQVDASRVYLVGVSNGGTMVYRCLMEPTSPPKYAAAVSFIATLPVPTSVPPPNVTTPLAIMLGTKDKVAKWNGGEFSSRLKGMLLSAIDTRDYWIAANRADPSRVTVTHYRNRRWLDQCRFESHYYPPIDALSAPVMMYTMQGGGHWVPSNLYPRVAVWVYGKRFGPLCREVEGLEVAYKFLSQYTL